jgi:uncharacterized protein YdhG (YjbR/CyaY superfamily)
MAFLSHDDYITSFSEEIQGKLRELQFFLKEILPPECQEVISYNMPAFKYHGMLVYFSAYKNHIGFYATPNAHEKFKVELSEFKQGKGSVQFPLNQTMPYNLIIKIIKFKVEENKVNAKK